MSRVHSYRISLFWLVVFCLLLITGILGYYLYQSYLSERKAIVKETSYLFVNTFQELEGDRLEDFVRNWTRDSLSRSSSIQKKRSDSTMSMRILKLLHDTDVHDLENTSVDINIEHLQHGPQVNEGAVSVFIQSSDSILADSLISNAHGLLSELQSGFKASAGDADLNIDYRIIRGDSLADFHNSRVVSRYLDSVSGDKYGIEVKNLGSYAFKKIIPEILLSIFVLLCTGLAFYTMYRQLFKEKQLSRQKQDLIQNITHELKTPVTTVSLALQAVSDFARNDPKKQLEYVDISKRELNRLSLLIDRVLSMNDLDSEATLFMLEKIELNALIDSIAYSFKVQLQEKNGKILTEYSDPNIFFMADRQQLAGIFYNLIDNAIKYNSSECIEIKISVIQAERVLHISVDDNGIGIPEKLKASVFNSFYRVPQGNTHNVKGYGLGLALVKKFILRLNGKITIHPSSLGGTRFNITIPHNL